MHKGIYRSIGIAVGIALFCALPFPAAAQSYTTVTVQPGDTISKIAIQYCTDWRHLYDINRETIGADPNQVEVGMVITVPDECGDQLPSPGELVYDRGPRTFATGRVAGDLYTAAWGDTVEAIGDRFGVLAQALLQDDGREAQALQPGQQMVVPGLAVSADEASPASAPSTMVGTYRFVGAPDEGIDYFLTLKDDGTAGVDTRPVGSTALSSQASGNWSTQGDIAVVTLTQERDQPLSEPEVIQVTFSDGFPTISQVEVEGTFYPLDEAVFTIGSGESHPLVRELHRRLAAISALNYQDPGPDGAIYDEATRQAVVTFQSALGLVPNGVVDARTWVLLKEPPPIQPAPTADVVAPAAPAAPAADAPPPESPGPPGERLTDIPDVSNLPTNVGDGSPIVYLTFDDGPQPGSTQPIIDLLAQYDAKASFFMVGSNASAYPDLVRAVVSSGHYAADHTWDHASLQGMTREQFIDEVERTRQAILDAAGDLMTMDRNVRYVRPPYGATDANTRQYATDLGFAVTLWTIDPEDWRRPGSDVIAQHVLSHVYPGAIVLMHDGGGDRSQTLAALETVLPALQAQGYQFHTVFLP